MRRPIVLLATVAITVAALPAFADRQITVNELLQVLRIHTWTIRVPTGAGQHWAVTSLRYGELHPVGKKPAGLTPMPEHLLALRVAGQDKLEYTLWESKDPAEGVEDLCKLGAPCGAPYELQWNSSPEYSADGEQAVLGQIVNRGSPNEKVYIVLVRSRRTN